VTGCMVTLAPNGIAASRSLCSVRLRLDEVFPVWVLAEVAAAKIDHVRAINRVINETIRVREGILDGSGAANSRIG